MYNPVVEKKMGSSFVVAVEESCGRVQVCGIEEIEAKWWMDGASKHKKDYKKKTWSLRGIRRKEN
jgi:hypothetical protein